VTDQREAGGRAAPTAAPGAPPTPAAGDRLTTAGLANETAIALGLGLLAAIVLTWPLAVRLGDIAHDPFDPLFQAWTIDWVQHAFPSPSETFDANIFTPEPNSLAYSDSLLGVAIPFLPLRWIGFSPIAQLNAAILLGFATSAASGYLFGRVVTRSVVVGAVTAAAFAFGPFGTLSSGALHATAHAGVGVAAAAAWWLADRARRDASLLAPAALLVAAIVWQASVSFYPGAYTVAAALVVLAVQWRALGRRGLVWAGGALAVSLVGILVLAIPYFEVQADQPTFERDLADLPALSADFGATDPRLLLWGPLLGDGPDSWPVYGEPAFPGIVLLVLAPIGLVAGWRAGGDRRRATQVASALVVVGAFLGIGTGPTGWRRFMPYRLLFEFVPGWSALRATGRAWVVGLLGVGILAGLGVAVLARWLARRESKVTRVACILTTIAVLGILFEGFAPWTDRPTVEVSGVDEALADLPPGGVLYVPALQTDNGTAEALTGLRQADNVYGTTAHHRETPNGYSGFFPPSWIELSDEVESLPSASALDALRDVDVRYIVVRDWAEGGPWGALLDPETAKPLRLVTEDDGDLLYEIPPADDR